MKYKTKNKGFSLIELVVVIAIMAVMSAVLVPSMISSSNEARMKTDNSAMGTLAQIYKSAVQEHETYYYFQRTIDLLEDGHKQVFFWYDVDEQGNVSYRAMNLKYPDSSTIQEQNEINSWASQLKNRANDYVNGSYDFPKMESRENWNKSYVITVTATNREYLVNVSGNWED